MPWYPPDAHDHREREHLDDWSMARGVRSGKFTQRDFDFTKPGANLEVVSRIVKPHAQAEFEQYRYPGGYTEVQRVRRSREPGWRPNRPTMRFSAAGATRAG